MTISIGILGNGAMATACAMLLAGQSQTRTRIWARDAEYARQMQTERTNPRFLPGITLPESVEVTGDAESVLKDADAIVLAVPTQFLRKTLQQWKPLLTTPRPILSVAKGVENGSFMRPSEIVADVLGLKSFVAISGPSHAEEICRLMPASVVAASQDLGLARLAQRLFNTDRFRVYTNLDLVGVELGGAVKNVIAIAAGISDGLGMGDNTKAALMTRGLVEMTRFGVRFGAEPATFSGLAGMGDLITTCVSPYGRNRRVGMRLGQGEPLEKILETLGGVAEGVATSRSIYEVSEQEGIEMPITREVYEVLFRQKTPAQATASLMIRPLRAE